MARSRTKAAQRQLNLRLIGNAKGVVVAKVAGIEDRDRAEALRGLRLYLPRDALPPPGDEEYYHADLIGLDAALTDGTPLGQVRAVHDFGAGDTLEIARPIGQPVMVPFTRAIVPVVDIAGGRLVVDPPPGLLDDPPRNRHRKRSRRHDLARHGADDLPGNAAGAARPFARRQGAARPASGGLKRWTSAISRAINTAPSTMRRLAAGRGW